MHICLHKVFPGILQVIISNGMVCVGRGNPWCDPEEVCESHVQAYVCVHLRLLVAISLSMKASKTEIQLSQTHSLEGIAQRSLRGRFWSSLRSRVALLGITCQTGMRADHWLRMIIYLWYLAVTEILGCNYDGSQSRTLHSNSCGRFSVCSPPLKRCCFFFCSQNGSEII